MELATANTGGDFTPPPAGVHRAICYRFIDLGTQESEWQGEIKRQHKILLSFELVDEIDEFEIDGKKIKAPFTVHANFTWSMHEKSRLRPFLESWRGRAFKDEDLSKGGFDAKNLVGVPCYLNVIHNEKQGRTYANISSISPLPKKLAEDMPGQHNPSAYLAIQKDRWSADVFDALSPRLKAKIEDSPEFKRLHSLSDEDADKPREDFTSEALDDDIPF